MSTLPVALKTANLKVNYWC